MYTVHWCVLPIQMALNRSITNSSIRPTFLIFYNTSHDHEYICGYYALIIVKLSFFFLFLCVCVCRVFYHIHQKTTTSSHIRKWQHTHSWRGAEEAPVSLHAKSPCGTWNNGCFVPTLQRQITTLLYWQRSCFPFWKPLHLYDHNAYKAQKIMLHHLYCMGV